MATLETDESNIIDADEINWRLIVYPVLAILIIGFGGLGYYYYHQHQIEDKETNARIALAKATTPEEFLKVADQFPDTDQATLAIMAAADASFDKHDYPAALDAYRKITGSVTVSADIRDAAELGIASVDEATGDTDKAIRAYLEVSQHGTKSPYAPFAYNAVARIYDQRGDKQGEAGVLQQAAQLDPDSPFTKQARYKLNQMTAQQQPSMSFPVPAAQANPAPAAPTPVAPAPKAPTPPASK